MGDIEKRFVACKINILKFSILLTAFMSFFFFVFHLIYTQKHELEICIDEIILIIGSFFCYKYVSENSYKKIAIIEFMLIFLTLIMLSLIFSKNVYLPIWMFGTLIVFTLSTDIYIGIGFLILSIIVFDFIFYKRVSLYSLLTLTFQFIAYFVFGVILIKTIEMLREKTFIYEKFLFESAYTDSLTKLYNRQYFEEMAKLLLEKAKRNNTKVLFLVMDLDNFKQINDKYGHPVGDLVLKEVAKTMKKVIRKSDLLARLGGEEFVLLIDNYNPKVNIAEKIRKTIEDLKINVENDELKLTISIGGIISKNYDYEYLYKKADEALYEAKKEKNKTVIINDL